MTARGNPSRQTAVANVIDRIEQHVLGHPAWVTDTTRLLKQALSSPKIRSDLRDWLALAEDSREEPVSDAVRDHLTDPSECDRATFFREAQKELKALEPAEGFLKTLAVIGLQYVVLYYNSNQREFRGAYLRSNLLSSPKLEAVQTSLRVPYRRGAVNWMTSFFSRFGKVAVIHDAALDLRGRVAAEDLVFGNHSVCGFPLLDPKSQVLGFFFVSHPVPRVFATEGVQEIIGEIKHKFPELGHAVEEDVIASFGAQTLQQSEAWREQAVPGRLGIAPIMSLADDSPTGFLAGLRVTHDRSPVEGVASTSLLDCHISEMPFINLVWWHLQLTSTFYDLWSDPIPRHLQRYADLLAGRPDALSPAPDIEQGTGSLPYMAWVRESRSKLPEDTLTGVDLTRPYYPAGVLEKLNEWTVNEHAGWLEWHERAMREAARQVATTKFHAQIDAALTIYSGPRHADLVVPVIGPDGESRRVVGWLRFNCDPPGFAREALAKPPGKFDKFHRLYDLIHGSLPSLNEGLGTLLSWTDDRLRRLPHDAQSIPLFKQLIDAARTVGDWTVLHLTDALAGKSYERRAGFDIVRFVYLHLQRSVESDPGGSAGGDERLARILKQTQTAIEFLGNSLEQCVDSLPEIPVLTLWLQSARPVIGVRSQAADSPSQQEIESLAQLLERDPGLPQLLTYLSFFASSREHPDLFPLDLCERVKTHAGNGQSQLAMGAPLYEAGTLIELGLPPDDAEFKSLEVTEIRSTEAAGAVKLKWQFEKSEGPKEITLEWDWSGRVFRPFPAAVQPVTGKVSRRIGAVIAKNARVSVEKNLEARANELIAVENAFARIDNDTLDHLRLLENALLPPGESPDPKLRCWKVVAVAEQEYLLMLVGHDQPSPIITAFRDIALAYERGSHLAWVRGHEHYKRESLAERLAAVSHGYTGPVGALRHEMSMTKTRWGAEDELPANVVLDAMKNFLDQASAIIRLGEAAIAFAMMEQGPPQVVSSVTGKDLSDYVLQVIDAYQPRGSRSIEFRHSEPWQLARRAIRLDEQIFIHGFSKILDNAVKSAQEAGPQSGPEPAGVLVDLELGTHALRLAISNVCSPDELEKALERMRRGLLTGEREKTQARGRGLGLREAWKCFQYLCIPTNVHSAPAPFGVTVELRISIAHDMDGRRP